MEKKIYEMPALDVTIIDAEPLCAGSLGSSFDEEEVDGDYLLSKENDGFELWEEY